MPDTRGVMSEHTYNMIELVGSSSVSIEAAVQNAIAKAAQDEKNLGALQTSRGPWGASQTCLFRALPPAVAAPRNVIVLLTQVSTVVDV